MNLRGASDRINVGAIGTGRISRGHDLPGIWRHDLARVVAVCDLDGKRLKDAVTLVNGGVGVRWMGDRVVTSVKVTNLGNAEVQQHIFGDLLRRQVVGEARFSF